MFLDFFLSDNYIPVSIQNSLHERRDHVYLLVLLSLESIKNSISRVRQNEWVDERIHKWMPEWNCVSLVSYAWKPPATLSFSKSVEDGLTWSVSRPWIPVPVWIIAQCLVNKYSVFHRNCQTLNKPSERRCLCEGDTCPHQCHLKNTHLP